MGFAVDIVQRAGSCVTGTYAGGPSTSWESIQERAQYDNNLIGECDNIALAALCTQRGRILLVPIQS
jgi:hypothetical protein